MEKRDRRPSRPLYQAGLRDRLGERCAAAAAGGEEGRGGRGASAAEGGEGRDAEGGKELPRGGRGASAAEGGGEAPRGGRVAASGAEGLEPYAPRGHGDQIAANRRTWDLYKDNPLVKMIAECKICGSRDISSKHIAMHQDGELPHGHILLEQFAKDHPLITDGLLCIGRTCPKMTDLGRRILSSAHQDVIESYYQNLHFGGNFLVSDLVVSEERKLYIRTWASAFSSTENKVRSVLLTLRRLHRHLLPFFLWDRKYALFISHLSKFMKSPPRQIYVSEPAFKKFIEAMYHHFSFVEHMDVHNRSSNKLQQSGLMHDK